MKDFFEENKIDWTTIEEYQGEGTLAGLCMALAESDKLLNYILNAQGYRGATIFEKIHQAKERFTNLENLAKALEIKENIFEQYDREVSKDEIKRAIKYYREAIKDLVENENPDLNFREKISAWFNYYFIFKSENMRKALYWFLGIILALIILDATHPGQALVHFFTNLIFKFSRGLIIFGVCFGAVAAIIIGLIIYFEKRGKK